MTRRRVSRETGRAVDLPIPSPDCVDRVLEILAGGGLEPTVDGRLILHYVAGDYLDLVDLDDNSLMDMVKSYDAADIRAAVALIAREDGNG